MEAQSGLMISLKRRIKMFLVCLWRQTRTARTTLEALKTALSDGYTTPWSQMAQHPFLNVSLTSQVFWVTCAG